MHGWQEPTDRVLIAASLAERRRRRRRTMRSTAGLVAGILTIGAAFGWLVHSARRARDAMPGFDLDVDLNLDLVEPRTSYAPEAMGGRRPLWSARTGARVTSAPVVAGGRVFARIGDEVTAHDASTGARLWATRTGGAPLGADFPPVVEQEAVYVSGSKRVHALDAVTGAERWSAAVPGLGGFPLTVAGDDVFVDAIAFTALDRETGALRWSASVGNSRIEGYSEPSVLGAMVIVGGGDGLVHAFDRATGQVRWTTPVVGAAAAGAGAAPSVVATDRLVYAASSAVPGTRGQLRALDPATGALRWSQRVPGLNPFGSVPTVSGTTVYVAGSTLAAFDAETGAPRWKAPTGGSTIFAFTRLAFDGAVAYVPGRDGRLHAVDTVSGRTLALMGAPPPRSRGDDASGSPVAIPPSIADGVLYLASGDRQLYAYAP